jgi:hypothetical protein
MWPGLFDLLREGDATDYTADVITGGGPGQPTVAMDRWLAVAEQRLSEGVCNGLKTDEAFHNRVAPYLLSDIPVMRPVFLSR